MTIPSPTEGIEGVYPTRFYNINIFTPLVGKEKILNYTFGDFMYEYDGSMPAVYYYIKRFNISKSDFLKLCADISSDEAEILFSEDLETIKRKLCNDDYLYYDGLFWLKTELFEEFKINRDFLLEFEMCADESTLTEFMQFLMNYVIRTENIEQHDSFMRERNTIEMYMNLIPDGTHVLDDYYPGTLMENGFPSVFYMRKEVRQTYNERFFQKSIEELNYLPTAYYLIRDMELKAQRDEFYQLNDFRKYPIGQEIGTYFLLDFQFELLFGDYEEQTLMRELKLPTVFYFEGRLYTIGDLKASDEALIEKMAQNEVFKEYLLFLRKTRAFNMARNEYGSLVDGWLEEYYGIK